MEVGAVSGPEADETCVEYPAGLFSFKQHAPRVTQFRLEPQAQGAITAYSGWGFQRSIGPFTAMTTVLMFPLYLMFSRMPGPPSQSRDMFVVIMFCIAGLISLRVLWLCLSYPVLRVDRSLDEFELRRGLLGREVVDRGALDDLRAGVFRWHVIWRRKNRVEVDYAAVVFTPRGSIVVCAGHGEGIAESCITEELGFIPRQETRHEPIRNPFVWF